MRVDVSVCVASCKGLCVLLFFPLKFFETVELNEHKYLSSNIIRIQQQKSSANENCIKTWYNAAT